jgi:hypothetical protein
MKYTPALISMFCKEILPFDRLCFAPQNDMSHTGNLKQVSEAQIIRSFHQFAVVLIDITLPNRVIIFLKPS